MLHPRNYRRLYITSWLQRFVVKTVENHVFVFKVFWSNNLCVMVIYTEKLIFSDSSYNAALQKKYMHYIAQETYTLHYTGNMLYITQVTHALHYTGNTWTISHRKHIHYIT